MSRATSTATTRRNQAPCKGLRSGRFTRLARQLALLAIAMIPSLTIPLFAYNSEEHKVLTNMGVAAVVIPAGIAPSPQTFTIGPINHGDHDWLSYTRAKNHAVGFATNDPADYDDNQLGVQDNSYWVDNGWGQGALNLELWVPPENLLRRDRKVMVYSNFSNYGPRDFGSLVALYGDYRRTTFCEDGTCFLTPFGEDPNIHVRFDLGEDCFGWPVPRCGFRPGRLPLVIYLDLIGSGLVPPFKSPGEYAQASEIEISEAAWWGDERQRIRNFNDWHFSNGAIAWYVGLHRLALLYAEKARSDPRFWEQALHYEANALHSLTDLFALGHLVVSRAETSHAKMSALGVLDRPAYKWMTHVTAMGGGTNEGVGRVALDDLPSPIRDDPGLERNDFLDTRNTFTFRDRIDREERHHTSLNESGAMVRNLAGNQFRIFGDGQLKLRAHQPADQETMAIIAESVRISVQSLFNAYADLDCGARTVEQIGAAGSSYFDALKLVPVFVEDDFRYGFDGRWVSYARFVDDVTEAGVVPADWQVCEIPLIDGGVTSLPGSSPACATFPAHVELQVPADDFAPACSVSSDWNLIESVRDASEWLDRNPTADVAAFDEFSPGIANGGGCLEDEPVELQLDGGTMTITPTGPCAISDASGTPAVSDLPLETFQYMTLDFDPPIEAFYANFGSVRQGERVRLWLNPDDSAHQVLETDPSPDDVLAFGHGFTSNRPVSRVIVQGTGLDVSVLGAFVGLAPREPSLGQVGPSGEYEADFAVVFSAGEMFSDGLESGDTSAWSSVTQ